MSADPMPAPNTPRKQPAMNSPYATQTQIEARIAARLSNPDRLRRALRLDNPNMLGERTGDIPPPEERGLIPTPTYPATA